MPRLRVLYGRGLDPEYFTRRLVSSVPGWEDALSRTIGDLERAGLTAAGLDRLVDEMPFWPDASSEPSAPVACP